MRWSQGVWSEKRILDAVNATNTFYAIPYGPSGTAPTGDVRAFELYFERLEAAGLGKIKRPDVLIFNAKERQFVDSFVRDIGGVSELPFVDEDASAELISRALLAVECENSLWIAEKMPDYNSPLAPQRRLHGRLGLRKGAVLPTIIIKDEDRKPLRRWEAQNKVPIHVWHVFYDRAYGLAFSEAERLIRRKLTEPTVQVFQAPGGATTRKVIYKHYYHYAYPLGISTEQPRLVPDFIQDRNGHILPYVKFEGGTLQMTEEALKLLSQL